MEQSTLQKLGEWESSSEHESKNDTAGAGVHRSGNGAESRLNQALISTLNPFFAAEHCNVISLALCLHACRRVHG